MVSFVREVFRTNVIPDGANDTLISLIPKCPHPESIFQFQPISLCYTSYMVISKIIVNWLRPFLNDFISPFQSSFIPGRRAVFNVVILPKIMSSLGRKRGRNGLMVVKPDLEKAYDRLEWDFIRQLLMFFKFPNSLVSLILNCISSTKINVLFNRGKLDTFGPSRGI